MRLSLSKSATSPPNLNYSNQLLVIIILLVFAFFSSRLLPILNQANWTSSPLAIGASRILYARSQVPWHNGVNETPDSDTIKTPFLPFIDYLHHATMPNEVIAHREQSGKFDTAKNIKTLDIMDASLYCDPGYSDAINDKAYLQSTFLNSPQDAQKTLYTGLNNVYEPDGTLQCYLSLFLLQRNDLHDYKSAQITYSELSIYYNLNKHLFTESIRLLGRDFITGFKDKITPKESGIKITKPTVQEAEEFE